jgi:hypothetical protein
MATTQDRDPGPKTKPKAKLETKGSSGDRGPWDPGTVRDPT